jgi:hypothetical protein
VCHGSGWALGSADELPRLACLSAPACPLGFCPVPCRHQGRLQLHASYNTWEIPAPEGDRLDMPHEGRINRAEGEGLAGAHPMQGHQGGTPRLLACSLAAVLPVVAL